MPLRMYQETSILEASKGYALSVVYNNNLMHVGETAFLYIIHTYGGGLFSLLLWILCGKLTMQNLQAIQYIK